MKYRDCMIAWNPVGGPLRKTGEEGTVKVGPHPDLTGWSDRFDMTSGAAFLERKKLPIWNQVALMLTDFHQMVVRDGVDPQVAHAAFLLIDEYRAVISPDIQGADDGRIEEGGLTPEDGAGYWID